MQSSRQAAAAAMRQIRRVGVGVTTKDVAQRADDDHAKSDEGERGAEEAHGAAGEVEEMGEGEVVVSALREERWRCRCGDRRGAR